MCIRDRYMNSMDNNTFYSFSLEKPLSYVATGKFEAPSQEWMHLDRWLGEDFELMVVTNGTLYICLLYTSSERDRAYNKALSLP